MIFIIISNKHFKKINYCKNNNKKERLTFFITLSTIISDRPCITFSDISAGPKKKRIHINLNIVRKIP